MRYLIVAFILSALLGEGCAGIQNFNNNERERARRDSLRQHWQQRVETGSMGKADFIAGELKNIDDWPFPLNKLEVFGKQLVGNPYEYGTCPHFIRNKNRNQRYRITTLFVINRKGNLGEVVFANDAGPCREQLATLLQDIAFTPSFSGKKPMPVLVVYPLDFDYKYGTSKE